MVTKKFFIVISDLVTNGDLVPAILKPGIWQAGLSRNLPHWLVEGDITFATSAATDHSIKFLEGNAGYGCNLHVCLRLHADGLTK